ncbi:TPA: M-related protein Mrp [Streptococcus pyogenes]|uniref:M-related protein Mrp n=2 Tax=Streptococcus pyogenes TaxID=1314 RepID=A0A660A269_STRPY|nr:M-related protein Mrp [Streptococcus pyogenes]EPZ48461.1 putative M protein, serotype 6 [Streptococcus pyogenes GA40634]HER4521771.1 M-related protein Mrp [Streptococcus pyogenes NGAS760]HER4525043.1 M-related protein Mrp [Streptococcus pyogenes NGAS758]HER4528441.1 M-related protein Mrp [Streptococcus pyogenes NGAS746]HER4530071.1 M-related protein Mrp [Streptococcus pyogenes NGAS759]HER4533293.1 M-related protein Mrp [Streptococcus pyogenes NGAS737]HER4543392.1 M-related protein Mrp [St
MSKRNPNKLYSLRKLKTGTASVAVALTVLGTGLANTTDVKAESRRYQAPPRVLLQGKEANKVFEERKALEKQARDLGDTINHMSQTISEQSRKIAALKSEAELKNQQALEALNNKNKQISDLTNENAQLKEAIEGYVQTIQNASREIAAKQQELAAAKSQLEAKNAEIEALKQQDASKTEEIAKLQSEAATLENLLGSAKRELTELQAKLDTATAEKAKLESQVTTLENLLGSAKRELTDLQAKLDAANAEKEKLQSQAATLEKQLEATKKELADLQAKLAATNQEKEKLEAEAKALKEQLAKQAEELAKLKADKASGAQKPDTKPGNKEVPTRPSQTRTNTNKAPMAQTKRQLPSTGEETTNPFFTAAALTVIASAGVLALKRKEEN